LLKPSHTSYAMSSERLLKIVAAVLLPPLGVGLHRGLGTDFCINVLLTLLGYIPGIIHAVFVVVYMGEKG
jgi:uncharacterized membrane protein YqaE (UPF0057 family)